MSDQNYVKCRLCDFKVSKWSRKKGGKPRLNFGSKLDDHYFLRHNEEWLRIQSELKKVDAKIKREEEGDVRTEQGGLRLER